MSKEVHRSVHLWRQTAERVEPACLSLLEVLVTLAALQSGPRYLKPLVPGEETEGSHGVTHKEPVDGLLHQVVEGLQGSDGGQAAQGGALLNEVGGLGREGRGH